jgi:hypothetical protein
MDDVLGLEKKKNDTWGKTMHTGTMDRDFTVSEYTVTQEQDPH